MKVVLVDNFDRETVSDVSDELLAEGLTEDEAKAVALEYNQKKGNNHAWFAAVRDNDYVLWDATRLYD